MWRQCIFDTFLKILHDLIVSDGPLFFHMIFRLYSDRRVIVDLHEINLSHMPEMNNNPM